MNNIKLSGSTFEIFITSILRQIASANNQEIFFDATPFSNKISENQNASIIFDAFAPDGFEKFKGVVVFEFKFFSVHSKKNHNKNILSTLDTFYKKISQIYKSKNVTGIIITNLSQNQIFHDNGSSNKYLNNVQLEIITQDLINRWIKEYPIDYSNALSLMYTFDSQTIRNFIHHITVDDFDRKSNSNIISLKSIIKNKDNFALVLGAGVSIDPGAKSWDQLLKSFTCELQSKHIINNSKKISEKIGNSALTTAQLCKELYPTEADYFWSIHQGLYENKQNINNDFALYHVAKIASICLHKPHFRILTYNYDNYLESYLDHLNIKYNSLFDSKCDINKDLSIYHVHGYLPQVNYKSHIQNRYKKSIYLTEENYNSLYNHPYSWQISSQLSFFRENICLFVGCSLSDPNIRRLLEMTKKENRTHYVILTKDCLSINDLTIASNHFARLGIEVIWTDSFLDICSKLRQLY